ncbi:DUF2806 domain-containing protein [Castellaniella sp.]|uniref:DUF2806 domain-containing protein n=1 Tax=Castellaniella sp. TaxID=1955812 RepID=UPI002AFEE55A|nr:DUF2806 domain-containing protein [Castellaniella sp.]
MTWMPGETLLTRIWESIEKLGSGLASPMQIKREGRARAEVRAYEIQCEDKARQEIAERIAMTRHPPDATPQMARLLSPTNIQTNSSNLELECAAEQGVGPVISQAILAQRSQNLRKLCNLRQVIRILEEEIENSDSEQEIHPFDEDWLNSWREGAEKVSNEHMQRLWARILSGESKNSGSFSMRTLEFIKSMGTEDAKLIEKAAKLFTKNMYFIKMKEENLRKWLTVREIVDLTDMGIISGSHGLNGLIWPVSVGPGKETPIFFNNEQFALILFSNHDYTAEIPVYSVSRMGQEILGLGKFKTPDEFVKDCGLSLGHLNTGVILAKINEIPETDEIYLDPYEKFF